MSDYVMGARIKPGINCTTYVRCSECLCIIDVGIEGERSLFGIREHYEKIHGIILKEGVDKLPLLW